MTDTRHTRQRSLPVGAYDPRLLNLLRSALRAPVKIDAGTPHQIRQLQRTLWSLLHAMEREGHPEHPAMSTLKLGLRTNLGEVWTVGKKNSELNGRTLVLLIEPRIAALENVLQATPESAPQEPVSALPAPTQGPHTTPAVDDDLQSILQQFASKPPT